jgi:DNA-binding response OmpR family regulator
MSRILLVEDDASLGRTLAERLEREKLRVEWAQTVAAARELLRAPQWDLAIVDVKLPDGSGFGLARLIKKQSVTPIMFMTALHSAEHRLEGFEIGADEYLPKPFHLREFILRVRRLLTLRAVPRTIDVAGRVIDLDRLTISRRDGHVTPLQVRDCRVLKLLIDSAPRTVDRSDILNQVWGDDRFPTPRAVDNAIVRLRQALGDPGSELIVSVRGIGYRWTGGQQ